MEGSLPAAPGQRAGAGSAWATAWAARVGGLERGEPGCRLVEFARGGQRLELGAARAKLGGAEVGGLALERVGEAADGFGVAGGDGAPDIDGAGGRGAGELADQRGEHVVADLPAQAGELIGVEHGRGWLG